MTGDPNLPTIRGRRLAHALRDLRTAAKLTQERAADKAGISENALWRIENAARRPRRRTIEDLLDVYRVTGQQRSQVLELWSGALQEDDTQPWHSDLQEPYGAFVGFEAAASVIRTWQGTLVPGLMQTAEYAAAVHGGSLPMSPNEVAERVRVRLDRQQALTRGEPPRVHAIIDEAALRRHVGGPEVLAGQIQHLADLAQRDNITLQVVPFTAGAHAAMTGPFVILGFESASDRPIVYVESPGGEFFFERDADVHRFERMFANIEAVALSPEESLELLATLAAQIDSGGGEEDDVAVGEGVPQRGPG